MRATNRQHYAAGVSSHQLRALCSPGGSAIRPERRFTNQSRALYSIKPSHRRRDAPVFSPA